MIPIIISEEIKEKAKNQIKEFAKTKKGKYAFKGVDRWKGVACELTVSDWLDSKFNVEIKAKGVDTSGEYDLFDLVIDGKKIEIKSAVKYDYLNIMPKKENVDLRPKDLYLAIRFNDHDYDGNEVAEIFGYTFQKEIQKCPVEQNKGAPYYKVPLRGLHSIHNLKYELREKK